MGRRVKLLPQGRGVDRREATEQDPAERRRMTAMDTTIERVTAQFLENGHHDGKDWPGGIIEGERMMYRVLLPALIAEIRRRVPDPAPSTMLGGLDMVAYTRAKISPMVRGLFSRVEQDTVLAVLERSVVVLTPANIEGVLRSCMWLSTAYDLANLYLISVGVAPLHEDARLVGLSEETTCYISPAYFAESDPFADFLVHEVAHIFHNCKREMMGLPSTRRKEWLLDIDFRRRETFAYSCEAYATIVARAATAHERAALAAAFAACGKDSPDSRVDWNEVIDIVKAACEARNGWKRILERCASRRAPLVFGVAGAAGASD